MTDNELLLALSDMMDKKLDAKLQPIRDDTTDIKLHLENVTDKNISLLAENHGNLIDKLNQTVKVTDKSYLDEIKVNILTEKVNRLEKEITELKNKIA